MSASPSPSSTSHAAAAGYAPPGYCSTGRTQRQGKSPCSGSSQASRRRQSAPSHPGHSSARSRPADGPACGPERVVDPRSPGPPAAPRRHPRTNRRTSPSSPGSPRRSPPTRVRARSVARTRAPPHSSAASSPGSRHETHPDRTTTSRPVPSPPRSPQCPPGPTPEAKTSDRAPPPLHAETDSIHIDGHLAIGPR